MKYLLTLALFLCTLLNCSAVSVSDTLLRINDLVFKNDFERNSFLNYENHKSDELDIFLNPYKEGGKYSQTDVNSRIDICVKKLEERIQNKSETKIARIVYEDVHETFLKVYTLENSFADIFLNGEYNCVSATALYALIFERLHVPYQIKETPRHVYLVAYPLTAKVLIETTIPEKGLYKFNDDFVDQFIKNLVRMKLITKEEAESQSKLDLFNKHYFASEDISLIQLAGLQYCNYGLYAADEKDYSRAIPEFKKSCFLYPCERTKFILKQSLMHFVGNSDYERTEDVLYLADLCRFNGIDDEDLSDDAIKGEFGRVMRMQLNERSRFEQFDSSFSIVYAAISDSVLKNDIAFLYHYELARLGLTSLKDTSYEIKHLSLAYTAKPQHADLQSMILLYFARLIERSNSPESIVSTMKYFEKKFSFINKNENYLTVKANCWLEMAYRNFSMNNIVKGENYLKEFEVLGSVTKPVTPDEVYVEKAYSTAAGAYFKKGNYAKSKEKIKTGLNYAPSNFRLMQMQAQF